MKHTRQILSGFVCFLLTSMFIVSLILVSYAFVQYEKMYVRLIVIFSVVITSAIICTAIDYFRRKYIVEKKINEIVDFTKDLSKSDFYTISIEHSKDSYDEFDVIKENLNLMSNELKQNEILKSDFLGNVSHEIKTPISIIQNYAKILEDNSLSDEERKSYLKNLQKNCKNLSDLVNNILKLNKLENQTNIIKTERFCLSDSLSNQIVNYIDKIEEKNIELVCDITSDIYIESEESYLNIIWSNLINNAIKFTNDFGKIEISLKKKNKQIIFKIKDNGIGISLDAGKRIFDKFYQGDTSHEKEGNGLGLALVKKVIDVLGGAINVESEENQGTTFTVTIKEE